MKCKCKCEGPSNLRWCIHHISSSKHPVRGRGVSGKQKHPGQSSPESHFGKPKPHPTSSRRTPTSAEQQRLPQRILPAWNFGFFNLQVEENLELNAEYQSGGGWFLKTPVHNLERAWGPMQRPWPWFADGEQVRGWKERSWYLYPRTLLPCTIHSLSALSTLSHLHHLQIFGSNFKISSSTMDSVTHSYDSPRLGVQRRRSRAIRSCGFLGHAGIPMLHNDNADS